MDIKRNYSQNHVSSCHNKKQKINTDGICVRKLQQKKVSLDGFRNSQKQNTQFENTHTILLKDMRARRRVPMDPERYIRSQKQRQEFYRKQYITKTKNRQNLDGLRMDGVKKTAPTTSMQSSDVVTQKWYEQIDLQQRIQNTYDAFVSYRRSLGTSFDLNFHFNLSPTRMWQLSLTGAMIFGMVSMSMIYRNLGQSAFAKEEVERALAIVDEEKVEQIVEDVEEVERRMEEDEEKVDEVVKKEQIEKEKTEKSIDSAVKKSQENVETEEGVQEKKQVKEVEKKPVDSVVEKVENSDADQEKGDEHENEKEQEKTLEELAYETVEGYPIEKMLPYILDQDPEVAKYLIAIAKQESGWGKRVPVLNGQDCYNYWGYRGIRKLMGTGGHTCFNSRKDAVETVGKRIKELIYEYDRTTADRLIVWKCGSSCAGHSEEGVNRWIGVVDTYYDKLSQ